MLVGRAAEVAGIAEAIERARSSEGRVVVVRGEAGAGKTALLDHAAAEPGLRVLRATGVEAESDLAYATAHQLLHPLLPLLDRLPEAQANAVGVALGTAAGETPDRFLVALGFLSLLSEAARSEPVLLLLDDAQWWDAPSLDAALFLARRVAAEPVAVLVAARGLPGGADDPLHALASLPGAVEVLVPRLADDDVGALLAAVLDVRPPEPVRRLLAERTQGNTLALLELARVLTSDQLAGRDPLPETVALGERLERPFLARAAGLAPDARALLLVAAAEPGGEVDVLTTAGEVADVVGALEEVEAVGLLRFDGRHLHFAHPLARSALYGDASAGERQRAHQRLAATLAERGEHDRAVWHRAAAAIGADDAVAGALDEVAARARRRSGYASSAAALERAAELSVTTEDRVERLVAAADDAWLAGQSARARLLTARAEPAAVAPLARARLLHQRARTASRNGEVDEAHQLFLTGAGLLGDQHPAQALEMLAEAVEVAAYHGDHVRTAEVAAIAHGLPLPTSPRERFLRAWLAVSEVGVGGLPPDGLADLDDVRAALDAVHELADPRLAVWAGIAALDLGDVGAMSTHYVRALELARRTGAAGSLPYVLEHAAMSAALAGNYAAARSSAEEGLRLAEESEQQRSAGQLHAILAFVAASRGDEEECLRHAEAGRAVAGPRGIGLTNATVEWSTGRLDLGLGRHDQALDRLLALAAARPGVGHPAITLWCTPDLVESAARARRIGDLGEALDRVATLARFRTGPGAAAAATWCRGLLGGAGAVDDLTAAATALDGIGLPLGAARARLSLGELLRRDRQPRAAREHLRAARHAFHGLGAHVWAERASAELRASGDGSATPESDGFDSLTPQELQIVRMVGRGASNRDVAAQLFLSPRTVEYHLYKAYPKLGISSRTQLVGLLAGQQPVGSTA